MRPLPSTRRQIQNTALIIGVAVRPDGERFPIGANPLVVGRNERADIVLQDPDASASHVQLVATPFGIEVEDLDSKNGTFVTSEANDEPHDWAKAERCAKMWFRRPFGLKCGNSELQVIPASDVSSPAFEQADSSLEQPIPPLVGNGPAMRAVFRNIRTIAPTDITVLITGETGVGKELVAEAIHELSRRRGPFVVVDCSAIPVTLAESALFGHVKGAFTGATDDQSSPFEDAEGGTIFLDEIGELPLEVQAKLLRAIQNREIKRVGGKRYISVDVRIVAATRRDLRRMSNDDTSFRSDLFYRLDEFNLDVPPLRERIEDLPALLSHFGSERGEKDIMKRLTTATMVRLRRYDWPGNVRQLKSVVRTGLVFWPTGNLPLEARLSADPLGKMGASLPAIEAFKDVTRTYFKRLTALCEGNLTHMAVHSGLDRRTVKRHLMEFGYYDLGQDLLDDG